MHSSTSPQTPPPTNAPQPNSKWHFLDEKKKRVVVRVMRTENGIVHYIHRNGQQAMLLLDLFTSTFERGA